MDVTKARSGVSAVVLAAGMSTRMGCIKQLLRIAEKTLLETVLDNLRSSRVDEIIVVLGGSAEAIRQQIPLKDTRVVINEEYQKGMGTSLRAGVAAIGSSSDAALIVLADQPFVRPETFDRLTDSYSAQKPHAAIPVYRGFRGNPTLLDRSLFPEIMMLAGDIGCRAIFGNHTENILKVPVDDIGVLLDVDTPGDLERFQRGTLGPEVLTAADLAERAVSGPQLVIVGDDAVAMALVRFGNLLHFSVTVVDPFLKVDEVPGADRVLHALEFSQFSPGADTYVVVASRGRFDEDAVEQAVTAGATYVALIAGKKRAQEISATLRARGVPHHALARLRSPAGLPIGAVEPEEIALSVMAEIVSQRRSAVTADRTG